MKVIITYIPKYKKNRIKEEYEFDEKQYITIDCARFNNNSKITLGTKQHKDIKINSDYAIQIKIIN